MLPLLCAELQSVSFHSVRPDKPMRGRLWCRPPFSVNTWGICSFFLLLHQDSMLLPFLVIFCNTTTGRHGPASFHAVTLHTLWMSPELNIVMNIPSLCNQNTPCFCDYSKLRWVCPVLLCVLTSLRTKVTSRISTSIHVERKGEIDTFIWIKVNESLNYTADSYRLSTNPEEYRLYFSK